MASDTLFAEEKKHLQDFLAVLLKWCTLITPVLFVTQVVEYVRNRIWTAFFMVLSSLLVIGAVSWCRHASRRGNLVIPTRLLQGTVLVNQVIVMLATREELRASLGIGFGLLGLLAAALERPQLALPWAVFSSACYVAGLVLPQLIHIPPLTTTSTAIAAHFVVVVQIVLIALLGKSMTRVLREALLRSEGARGALQSSNEALERQKADLERAQADLDRSNRELRTFFYATAHDLRTPLRALTNYSSFLQQDCAAVLDPTVHQHVQGITESARYMDSLIRGLLDYSRIEQVRMQMEPVDVRRLLEGIVKALRLSEGADLSFPANVPPIHASRAQLEQIFSNLLSNAVKFQQKGARPTVAVEYRELEKAWEFAVRDNGIGIDPKYFDKIFGLFQRLHTQAQYEGTGVGLAIVKKAVEEHGGQIVVESAPGQGSVFRFTLLKSSAGGE
jgi:signal transduction histidine kinase